MKRTITRLDGSIEVMEGTPKEFAELERELSGAEQLQSDLAKPKQARQELTQKRAPPRHEATCLIMLAEKGWWSVTPPVCTCGSNSSIF